MRPKLVRNTRASTGHAFFVYFGILGKHRDHSGPKLVSINCVFRFEVGKNDL